ncbi:MULTISPECIES: DUF397 domain-containing protein [Thermomonosporaceae]|uniref:DUF397 domain-containing protein n=1 Tax=Thermomonosporaceae TaxID=2012 RepID=UPI00255AD38D|nr:MULTISPECIES: DUF397 domain-containing protein [Thermomonosporaceae]MDL4771948.1 DUF397 domain-containing protein [Actinomadura xylanilytica]
MTIWRKSSHSGSGGTTECVELADLDAAVGIRDSRNPSGPHLSVARRDLAALVGRVKSGELEIR